MSPDIGAAEYARRWEETDTEWIRQFPPEEVQTGLWPWLKMRGYATDGRNNIRAALDYLEGTDETDLFVGAICGLWFFWWLHGHVAEGEYPRAGGTDRECRRALPESVD